MTRFWNPDYVPDGLVKLATGLVSAATAVLVFATLPQALALRTPIELQREVDAQTAELLAVNARLQLALEKLAEADQRKNQFLATLARSRAGTGWTSRRTG